LLKTAIMMIGEFEFDSIFNESGVKVFYPHAAYIIFICFVIAMSIIIMNLLVSSLSPNQSLTMEVLQFKSHFTCSTSIVVLFVTKTFSRVNSKLSCFIELIT